jgi:hypothetical protein
MVAALLVCGHATTRKDTQREDHAKVIGRFFSLLQAWFDKTWKPETSSGSIESSAHGERRRRNNSLSSEFET